MAYVSVNGKLVKKTSGMIPGKGFKMSNAGGFITFDYKTEMNKAIHMVVSDPPPFDTRATKADYNSTPFGKAGFLLALVPYNGVGVVAKTNDSDKVKAVLDSVQAERISEKWVLLRTYITRDLAYKLFCDIHDAVHTAFIAYSTPENISTLSEDKALCLALRNLTDPVEALEIVNG